MQLKILAATIAVLIAGVVAVTATHLPEDGSGKSASPPRPAAPPIGKVPVPKGKVVLRITGVTAGNAGSSTKADFATLDRLARETVTVREPFLKRDLTFTVVRMSDLLSAAGVPASATTLYGHALDAYHVDLPLAEVRSDGYLATRMSGKPIAIADGGPVRLVFTGSGRLARNRDNWIWSMDSMRAHR
jgi:hypothetical protein